MAKDLSTLTRERFQRIGRATASISRGHGFDCLGKISFFTSQGSIQPKLLNLLSLIGITVKPKKEMDNCGCNQRDSWLTSNGSFKSKLCQVYGL